MDYTRRRAILLGTLGITGIGGCAESAEFLAGDGPLEREAAMASVGDSTLDETGYSLVEDGEIEETLEYSVDVGGEERKIIAGNKGSIYQKPYNGEIVEIENAGIFGVVSTPGFYIPPVDETVSPAANWEYEKAFRELSSQFEDLQNINDIEQINSYDVTTLETETEVEKYTATADIEGAESQDLILHITRMIKSKGEDRQDVVIALGGYLAELDDEETDVIENMFTGLQYSG